MKSEDQNRMILGFPMLVSPFWDTVDTVGLGRTRWAVGRVELSGVDELNVSLLQAVEERIGDFDNRGNEDLF